MARTFCRICEAVCGLTAETDASGRLTLAPDRAHPVSQGYVCAKGLAFAEHSRGPTRLLHPTVRGQRVGWDEAYAEISRRARPLRERHGPHALGVYFGNPLAFNALAIPALFGLLRRLGTRNVFSAVSQDCGNKFAGAQLVHGSPVIHPIPDFERCQLAVLFGTNPYVSQSSFVHLGDGARVFDRLVARGAEVVWVDPRRHESAQRWGSHLPLRPGSDVWLLLALLSLLAPERPEDDPHAQGLVRLVELARSHPLAQAARLTGLPEQSLHALAAQIRRAGRVAFHMSVGVNQGRFGTLCYVLLQALAYVTGNLDREGGSLFHPLAPLLGRAARLARVDARGHRSRVGGFPTVLDTLPGAVLAQELTTPGPEQVRGLVCLGGNPLRSIPGSAALDKALSGLSLLVCVDTFQTELTRRADVALPACGWLERFDFAATALILQTSDLLHVTERMAPPAGESRTDARIFAELSCALGRPLLFSSAVTHRLARLDWDGWLGGAFRALGRASLRLRHGVPLPAPRPHRYLGEGPLHPDARLRFWDERLEDERARLAAAAEEPQLGSGQLLLIGRRRRLGHNSWLHREGEPEVAWVAPAELRARSLASGQTARLRAADAELTVMVEADEGVLPGTVVVPHGLLQANVNALLPSGAAAAEPLSGQHWMTGVPVQLTG